MMPRIGLIYRFSFAMMMTTLLNACVEGTNASHSTECLQHAPNDYVVALLGAGFIANEGHRVYAVTDINLASTEVRCRALSVTTIEQGKFGIELTNVTDDAVYPVVSVFIDVNDTRRCERSQDLLWKITSVIISDEIDEVRLSPTDFTTQTDQVMQQDVCGYFSEL